MKADYPSDELSETLGEWLICVPGNLIRRYFIRPQKHLQQWASNRLVDGLTSPEPMGNGKNVTDMMVIPLNFCWNI